MLIGFNLATGRDHHLLPADQWVGLLTTVFVVGVAVLLRGFLSRIAIFLGAGVRLPDLLARRPGRRGPVLLAACRPARRPGTGSTGAAVKARTGSACPRTIISPDVRGADRPAPARLQADLHPAGDPVGDRAAGRELRPRQGRVGDDRRGPRPVPRPGVHRRRRRHRAGLARRRLADHHLRREHRRDGRDPDLLHAGLLHRRDRGHPVRVLPEVRRGRRRPPPAGCSAASPWCCTG